MAFQATGSQIHRRTGAFASLRRGLREAFTYAGGVQIENRLLPSLDSLQRAAADGTISEIGVGLNVTNASAHALEYELTLVRMTLEGRHGIQPALSTLRGEVAPGRTVTLAECLTAIAPQSAGATLQGSFEFALRYGLRGGARHRLTAAFAMAFKSASAREIAAFTWYPI